MTTPSEIPEHRERWFRTLEEGGYPRAEGVLCKVDKFTGEPAGFCCLGVAEDLAETPFVTVPAGVASAARSYGNDGATQLLSPEGREWLGVTTDDPRPNFPRNHALYDQTAASLNDHGTGFADIAHYFREFGFHPKDDVLQIEVQVQ